MNYDSAQLRHLIAEMALLLEQNEDPDPQSYVPFFQHPEFAFQLIEIIDHLDEELMDEGPPLYSACIFALNICIAQMQAGTEANNKVVAKSLIDLMNKLAVLILSSEHGLSFWLPILNAFYEVHVDLTQDLKNAYFELASQGEGVVEEGSETSHMEAMKDLIHELSDLSLFEIAENFFAQSYAMPQDFFADLMVDLCSIEEGKDVAILLLLHPKLEVREVVAATLNHLIDQVTLSSISITRLQVIKFWYPQTYHSIFDFWIRTQRKKGVVFETEPELAAIHLKATEVDGTGSQGIFIHLRQNRKSRLAGLLIKYGIGLKDAWITPVVSAQEVTDYYNQAFDGNVTLRKIDLDYFQLILEHFLAITLEKGDVPDLHFLEIQELLGIRLRPHKLDIEDLFNQLGVQIVPFTQEVIQESLVRSKSWLKNKSFTESWFLESPGIDKIVNHNSSFIEGVKVCRLIDAMEDVFDQEMELNRSKWEFHFLWMALWAKAHARRNEKVWQDNFLIAYSIRQGTPLKDIPVMKEICYQTVINSVETMQDRRTYLSQE